MAAHILSFVLFLLLIALWDRTDPLTRIYGCATLLLYVLVTANESIRGVI